MRQQGFYRHLVRVSVLGAGMVLPVVLRAQRTEIGGRVGWASSYVAWEAPGPIDSYSSQNRRTVAGGVFVRHTLWRGLSAQPELLLVGKGFNRTEPMVHATYLEAPLLLRADYHADELRLFVEAGAALAYELRCRVSYMTLAGPFEGDCNTPGPVALSTATRRVDLGRIFGAGLALRAGPGSIVLDMRHTRGLRDIDTNPGGERMLNRSTALTAGYAVPLHR
jgi:hypothetical protein